MIVSLVYKVTRKPLSVPAVLPRRDTSKDAELLVLRHENAVLRQQVKGPVRYEPTDRFWFAALSALIPRRLWRTAFPVTPGTLLARHRRFIAASTVWEILHAAGVDPTPRRSGPTWREFLTAQTEGSIACDFLHFDTALGSRLYALVFLGHGTRRLHIACVTAHPTQARAVQQVRNLAADLGTRLESLRFLLRDRDDKYGETFDAASAAEEMKILKSAPRAPQMNAHCERIIGSIRREALDHVLIMGGTHARQVLATYKKHYKAHRPHRARSQLLPDSVQQPATVQRLRYAQRPAHPRPRRRHQRVPLRDLSSNDDFPSPTGDGCGQDGTRTQEGAPPPLNK
ncbi:integrase core domain-containing protein [Streptomyces sp. NTH33]|uniref:integrase core domain-containing protein n=1 Tax=Streptomyces sp. NTH33 TaxID=1735453 RepID=UPI0026C630CC|nr:integrase core domain-containing protein [Streptomyces sp. NTH33]